MIGLASDKNVKTKSRAMYIPILFKRGKTSVVQIFPPLAQCLFNIFFFCICMLYLCVWIWVVRSSNFFFLSNLQSFWAFWGEERCKCRIFTAFPNWHFRGNFIFSAHCHEGVSFPSLPSAFTAFLNNILAEFYALFIPNVYIAGTSWSRPASRELSIISACERLAPKYS